MRCQQECGNKQQEMQNVMGRKEKIVFYVLCEKNDQTSYLIQIYLYKI